MISNACLGRVAGKLCVLMPRWIWMNPRAVVLAVASLALWPSAGHAAGSCGSHPWCNARLSPAQRASMVLGAMTTAEKLALVASGSAGVARLGIPPLKFIDGPNGIGEGNTRRDRVPGCGDDRRLVGPGLWPGAYGQALGAEAAGKGSDWLFAPTINIVRTPLWGREAETLGEDPVSDRGRWWRRRSAASRAST